MAKDRTTVADLITGSLVSISSQGTTHTHTHDDTLYTLDDSLWLATFETTFRFMTSAHWQAPKEATGQVTYSNQTSRPNFGWTEVTRDVANDDANSPLDEALFICFDKVAAANVCIVFKWADCVWPTVNRLVWLDIYCLPITDFKCAIISEDANSLKFSTINFRLWQINENGSVRVCQTLIPSQIGLLADWTVRRVWPTAQFVRFIIWHRLALIQTKGIIQKSIFFTFFLSLYPKHCRYDDRFTTVLMWIKIHVILSQWRQDELIAREKMKKKTISTM